MPFFKNFVAQRVGDPGRNDQRSMLEENYLQGVFYFFIVMSTTIIPARIAFIEWFELALVQWGICIALSVTLYFRHGFSPLFISVGTNCTILVIEFIDISQGGLSSPAILGLTVLPVGNTVVWGKRAGIISLIGASALFLLVGAYYLDVHPDEFKNTPIIGQVPLTWIIASFGLFCCGLWGIVVVTMQRNFWADTVEKLHSEHEKRLSSDRRQSEIEQRWQSLSQTVPGVIFDFVHLPDGTNEIRLMSEGSRELLDIEPQKIEADITVLMECLSPETRKKITDLYTESRRTLAPVNYRVPIITASGKKKWIHGQGRPTELEGGEVHWHSLILDITREIEAEAEARLQAEIAQQSQKQKSIGQLTGGVAHDFNNLLAIILGNLELAKGEIASSETQSLIDSAIDATYRGADLTRNLLAFSRQAPLNPKLLDLNAVIQSTTSWTGRTIPENCIVETSFMAGLWKANLDEGSTVSALVNLLLNARDAMPDGGRITIETSNIRVNSEYVELRHEDIVPGRYVLVSVSDTGSGILPENLDIIFEPFYTTKAPGSGTGLGLAMIFGFMKQSGGTVRVYSELGVGTTFKLYFPAHTGTAAPDLSDWEMRPIKPTKGVKLLVVEDEKVILDTIQKTLTREGYIVTAASSGDEAAEIFKRNSAFDVLVTDIVMPGELQGTTLARKLREMRDDLPVVFMSGYASEATVHGNGLRVEDVRLMKPVGRRELVEGIEDALKRRGKA